MALLCLYDEYHIMSDSFLVAVFVNFAKGYILLRPTGPFDNQRYETRRPSMSKTILITGASSGFGRDTAVTLFRAGHTVYASMRRAQGKNREAAEALQTLGLKTAELDVSDDASVEAGVKNVLAEAGKIDVLVNNAGIGSVGVTEAFTAEQAKVIFDTNVT